MVRPTLIAAVLTALLACAAASAAEDRLPLSLVQDDAQLLRSGAGARDATLDDWQRLGADMVRIVVVWQDAARDPSYLAALDAAVAGARQRGLDVLLNPTTPGPVQASRCRVKRPTCDPSPKAWRVFVKQLALRYPLVHHWTVLNEPNNPNWLTPQQHYDARGRLVAVSPRIYRTLVRSTVRVLRRYPAHREDTVLAGEAAPMGSHASRPPAQRPIHPARFLREFLSGHRRLPIDGLSHHPYSRGGVAAPLDKDGAEDLTTAGLDRLEHIVRLGERRGVLRPGTPIWLTEDGFQSNPPDATFGVAPWLQSRYINEAEWAAAEDDRVVAMAQYLMTDERDLSRFQSGLRYADGRAKPALAAYRTPLVVRRFSRTRVRVWGRTRPQPRAGVAVEVLRDGDVVTTVRTTAGGLVDVNADYGTGRWQLRWTDDDGTVRTSRRTGALIYG